MSGRTAALDHRSTGIIKPEVLKVGRRKDTGPTPNEIVLSALGACTAITLRMYAQRKQWPLDEVEVELAYLERGKDRSVIERRVHLRGPLDDEQRTRLLQVANACPAHRLLTGQVEIPTVLAA